MNQFSEQTESVIKPAKIQKPKITRESADQFLQKAEKEYSEGGQTPTQAMAFSDALFQRAKFGSKQEKALFKNRAVSVLEEANSKEKAEKPTPVEQITRYNLQKKLILALQKNLQFERAYEVSEKLINDPFVKGNFTREKDANALLMTSVVGIKDGSKAEKVFDEKYKEIDVVLKTATLEDKIGHLRFMKKVIDDSDANVKWGHSGLRRMGYFFGITEKSKQVEAALLAAEREMKRQQKMGNVTK